MEPDLFRLTLLAYAKSGIKDALDLLKETEADKDLAETNPAKYKQKLDDLTLAVNLYEKYIERIKSISIESIKMPNDLGRFQGNEENLDGQPHYKLQEMYSKNLDS